MHDPEKRKKASTKAKKDKDAKKDEVVAPIQEGEVNLVNA